MTDRDKVRKGLECCKEPASCRDCPYPCYCEYADDWPKQLLTDALNLINEQETANTGSCRIFQCKKCGFGIDDIFVHDEEKYQIVPRYCPNCGRLVK